MDPCKCPILEGIGSNTMCRLNFWCFYLPFLQCSLWNAVPSKLFWPCNLLVQPSLNHFVWWFGYLSFYFLDQFLYSHLDYDHQYQPRQLNRFTCGPVSVSTRGLNSNRKPSCMLWLSLAYVCVHDSSWIQSCGQDMKLVFAANVKRKHTSAYLRLIPKYWFFANCRGQIRASSIAQLTYR
jgi:hypothetical protein